MKNIKNIVIWIFAIIGFNGILKGFANLALEEYSERNLDKVYDYISQGWTQYQYYSSCLWYMSCFDFL